MINITLKDGSKKEIESGKFLYFIKILYSLIPLDAKRPLRLGSSFLVEENIKNS